MNQLLIIRKHVEIERKLLKMSTNYLHLYMSFTEQCDNLKKVRPEVFNLFPQTS